MTPQDPEDRVHGLPVNDPVAEVKATVPAGLYPPAIVAVQVVEPPTVKDGQDTVIVGVALLIVSKNVLFVSEDGCVDVDLIVTPPMPTVNPLAVTEHFPEEEEVVQESELKVTVPVPGVPCVHDTS